MTACETTYAGWRALALENESTRLVMLPEVGGKIVSLTHKDSGTELLWQDPTRPYRSPIYGDEFGNYDASGFDECFPTIGASRYTEPPWEGTPLVDHGELWCTPWRAEVRDDRALYGHAYGVRFPYHFERTIELADDGPGYTLRYRLTNLSPFDLRSMWSAHPLFAARPGMRVLFPDAPKMRLTHATGERIAGTILGEYTWPFLPGADGAPLDYDRIGGPELRANDKVYVETPAAGWCALYDPGTGLYAGWTLRAAEVPFVGVCINHGGWPFTGARGYWVAIEPCTGWPDPLEQAVSEGAATLLSGWDVREWSLGLRLGVAATTEAVAETLGTRAKGDIYEQSA
jgi:hypothetical protein